MYGYTYDSNVYLTSIIKPSGTTNFLVNINSLIASVTVTDPLGNKEFYEWNGYSSWYQNKRQTKSGLAADSNLAPRTVFGMTMIAGQGMANQVTYEDGGKVLL